MKLRMKTGEVITVIYIGPEDVEVPGKLVNTVKTITVVYGNVKNELSLKKFTMEDVEGLEK